MTHDAKIHVTGVGFKDYCEGLIASTFDVNALKVGHRFKLLCSTWGRI